MPGGEWLASWLGEAVNWECDELGHLNMRHYVGKAEEARRFLFIHLGLDHAFLRGAASGVRARRIETCYLKEARPGARLSIRSGLTRLGEHDADVVHIMEHADGARAATIAETVEHVSRRTQETFAWPSRLREAASRVRVAPDDIGPRGLPTDLPVRAPGRDAVARMGAQRVGAGVFRADEADVFGQVRPHALQGRVSESVGNFRAGWPEAYDEGGLYDPHREGEARYSGVLLEMRVHLHAAAHPGRAYEVWSGLRGANANVRTLVHHVVDPASGESYASMVATGAILDLHERRLVKCDATAVARLMEGAVPEITP